MTPNIPRNSVPPKHGRFGYWLGRVVGYVIFVPIAVVKIVVLMPVAFVRGFVGAARGRR